MDIRTNLSSRNFSNTTYIKSSNGSATKNAIVLWSDNSGHYVNNSTVTIDESGNIFTTGSITAAATIIDSIALEDNETITFGTGSDVTMQFNSTNFIMEDANNTSNINFIIKLGDVSGLTSFKVTDSAGANQFTVNSDGLGFLRKLGIGTTSIDTSAAFEVDSTDGAILFPRMTSTQRNALTPTSGMMIYSTTNNRIEAYENGVWVDYSGVVATDVSYLSTPSFISLRTTVNSSSTSLLFDVFQTANVSILQSNAITHTTGDGRFTVDNIGNYLIQANLIINSSSNVVININVNGSTIQTYNTYVHGSVDPVERTITMIQTLSAGDYINCTIDGVSTSFIVTGSSMSITSLGNINPENIGSSGNISLTSDADADDITADSAVGRLSLGVGEDLNIYHGGTNSYIVNNTGDLIVNPTGNFDIQSTSGMMIIPRMTAEQRDDITPINGMIMYNSTSNQFEKYDNSLWSIIGTKTIDVSGNYISYNQEQGIQSSDYSTGNRFGLSNQISGDGKYIVSSDFAIGTATGAAYVFTRNSSNTWTEQQKLIPSDGVPGDQFGLDVDINYDGTYIIVGAHARNSSTGAVYIFTRSGTTWSDQQIIVAEDAATSESFGRRVKINHDATYILIGNANDDTVPTNSGSAYIFTRTGTTWSQQAKLEATNIGATDEFGGYITMNFDATYVAIGARREDNTFTDTGAVYIFTRTGTSWDEQQILRASDKAASDFFGSGLSMNADATWLAVGATFEDGAGTNSGAVYIFNRSGSTWTETHKLIPDDLATVFFFGEWSSMTPDGVYLAISAHHDDILDTNNGSVYIYKRHESNWTQLYKIYANDYQTNTYFGYDVSISDDAQYIVVGTDNTLNTTYVFKGYTGIDPDMVIYRDEKANNTMPENITSGSWQQRELTQEYVIKDESNSFGTLTSNQFTLSPGVYSIEATVPSWLCNRHKAKFYNTTTGVDEIIGTNTYSENANYRTVATSFITGVVTITSTSTCEIRDRVESTNSGGVRSIFSVIEVYSTIKITKLK